jgi:spermidine synthase
LLTNDILAMDDGLDRFIADMAAQEGVPPSSLVSTDDNLYLEYETPRGNVLHWQAREALVALLRNYTDSGAIAGLETEADAARAGAN